LLGILLGIAGVIVSYVAGETLLGLVYSQEYAAYHDLFVHVMVVAGLGYVTAFLGTAVVATQAFQYLTVPHLILTALTISFGWLLITHYGMYGAVWTIGIKYVASSLFSLSILWRLEHGKVV
jgi:O-antigen/teichoic acid export membrane protein